MAAEQWAISARSILDIWCNCNLNVDRRWTNETLRSTAYWQRVILNDSFVGADKPSSPNLLVASLEALCLWTWRSASIKSPSAHQRTIKEPSKNHQSPPPLAMKRRICWLLCLVKDSEFGEDIFKVPQAKRSCIRFSIGHLSNLLPFNISAVTKFEQCSSTWFPSAFSLQLQLVEEELYRNTAASDWV